MLRGPSALTRLDRPWTAIPHRRAVRALRSPRTHRASRGGAVLRPVDAFHLVLVASGRPCDLDDGFRACWAAKNLRSAFLGVSEGVLGVPERQPMGHQFLLDRL